MKLTKRMENQLLSKKYRYLSIHAVCGKMIAQQISVRQLRHVLKIVRFRVVWLS